MVHTHTAVNTPNGFVPDSVQDHDVRNIPKVPLYGRLQLIAPFGRKSLPHVERSFGGARRYH